MSLTNGRRDVLLETSIAVDFFNNDAAILQRLTTVQAVVSITVLGELYTGAYLATKVAQQLAYVAGLVGRSRLIDCDRDTAERFGFIRADLQRRGKMIPVNDIWIAASALQHGLPLATRDNHFKNVTGLVVEQW